VDGQALLHCREAVDGTFARRTLVLVILGDVDESALLKRPSALALEVIGLGTSGVMRASVKQV
jgi:hypothetical protein